MKRKKIYFIYIITLLVLITIIALLPEAFQKCCTIRNIASKKILNITENKTLDVKQYIGAIPYTDKYNIEKSNMIYDVNPYEKYKATVLEGKGNCSNLVFGTAYYLNISKIDYQIIHILPHESFLNGGGHSVMRLPYLLDNRKVIGIVDVAGGGIPQYKGKALDIADFQKENISKFTIRSFSNIRNSTLPYNNYYLGSDMTFGYITSTEIKRYFEFVEKYEKYIPDNSPKMKKYITDGVAVVLGYYPKIYVLDVKYLFKGHRVKQIFFIISLWVLRVSLLIIPFIILLEVIYWAKLVRKWSINRSKR